MGIVYHTHFEIFVFDCVEGVQTVNKMDKIDDTTDKMLQTHAYWNPWIKWDIYIGRLRV